MAPELTCEFYRDSFGGAVTEKVFDSLKVYAQACVDSVVSPTLAKEDYTPEQVQGYLLACCAALDVFAQYGTTSAGGFTIGSFSLNAASESDPRVLAIRTFQTFLVNTGLLFSGVR